MERTEKFVLEKYDQMAGSYLKSFDIAYQSNSPLRTAIVDGREQMIAAGDFRRAYVSHLCDVIFSKIALEDASMLEVGAGELTTLFEVSHLCLTSIVLQQLLKKAGIKIQDKSRLNRWCFR